MRLLPLLLALLGATAGTPPAWAEPARNVILFVADGLRAGMVTPDTTPTMARLAARGVLFANPHSQFPTFTTANAAALATGHMAGDNGDFSNVIDIATPIAAAGGAITPFLENDAVLGEVDRAAGGDYLNETTFLQAARANGVATASIGKVGPVLIQDHLSRDGMGTIMLDDQTGHPGGIPLAPALLARLAALKLPAAAPGRGDNANSGTDTTPGTTTANLVQQAWFNNVAIRAVLPMLAANPRGFTMVYWSRDPDGTQHNQGDSLDRLLPGINGPTSRAAIANADADLARLLTALHSLGLDATTDVIVVADHGFSTISKDSATSQAARDTYPGVTPGLLPPGFLALDLAAGLEAKLYDPYDHDAEVPAHRFPRSGSAIIGPPAAPLLVVAANGGSDLIYMPTPEPALARRVVGLLAAQDYISGIFVDDRLGRVPGTLPLSAIGLRGTAVTPTPAIVVSFRSFSTGCAIAATCTVEIADTTLQPGQGMHGSFSRADTNNAMLAAGPDFRAGFVDPAPAANIDVGRTILHLLGLSVRDHGKLVGRVLTEALNNGAPPRLASGITRSRPDALGNVTVLHWQQADKTMYFDAAGYPGRTVGIAGK